jgi:hypothetical protein
MEKKGEVADTPCITRCDRSALMVTLPRFGPEAAEGTLNAVMALVVPTPGILF